MRTGDWQWGTSIQHEVMPRVSAEFGYQHRWLLNFTGTDNRAVSSSDYDRFSVIIPSDSRLPNGGGGQLADIFNLTDRLNVINFAGLLSGTAVAPRRTVAIRLHAGF